MAATMGNMNGILSETGLDVVWLAEMYRRETSGEGNPIAEYQKVAPRTYDWQRATGAYPPIPAKGVLDYEIVTTEGQGRRTFHTATVTVSGLDRPLEIGERVEFMGWEWSVSDVARPKSQGYDSLVAHQREEAGPIVVKLSGYAARAE